MDGKQELQLLAEGFRHPLPQPDTIKRSRIEMAVWKSAIEALEHRLLLANAMLDGAWMDQPIDRRHQIDESAPALTLHDIQQMTLLLDGFIIKQSSQPQSITLPFNLKKALERLIRFKLAINTDAACRLIFSAVWGALKTGEKQSTPPFYSLPMVDGKDRMWYRYYGLYSGLLDLIHMDGKAISSITFKPEWLSEDEGIIMMLTCYAIQSGRDSNTLMRLHDKASELKDRIPSAQSLLSALKALQLRASAIQSKS